MGLKFCYGLLIRDVISLASSNNDSRMLLKQKCKQRYLFVQNKPQLRRNLVSLSCHHVFVW